ncbi:Sterile alpha and TIR motif-containing protein tir-1, partial [Hondaea fermentalgiana]
MVIKLLVSMFREQEETVFRGLLWRLYLVSPESQVALPYDKIVEKRASGKSGARLRGRGRKLAQIEEFDPFFVEQIGALDSDEDGAEVAQSAGIPPLGPSERTHVFLSHVQSTGGDLAGILRLKLENRGLKVWYDQGYRGELNMEAMLDGVRHTHTYVLVLTKGIFDSGAVLQELRCALDSEKHIVVVHEPDTHRAGY